VGGFFGFDAARVIAIDVARGIISLSLNYTLHSEFKKGHRCEIYFSRLDAKTFMTAFEVL
jgi:hypothetical protein